MLGNSIALLTVASMFGLEAWKASGRIARIVLTVIAVMFALSGFLLQQLTDTAPRIGGFVSETFSAPSSWFVLLIALFFVLRPYWARGPQDVGGVHVSHLETRIESAETAASGAVQEAERLKLIFAHSMERYAAAQEEIASCRVDIKRLGGELDGFKEAAQAEFKEARTYGNMLEARQSLTQEQDVQKLTSIRSSLNAIYLRELLSGLAAKIVEDAGELYLDLQHERRLDGQSWSAWETVEARWREHLGLWISQGKSFAPEVESEVWTIDDERYGGDWSVKDEQFPNAEAVRRFKKHRLIYMQWLEVRKKVDWGVIGVAYLGLTGEDVRHG